MDAGELAARFRVQTLVQTGIDTHIGVADTLATAATASARTGRSGVLHLPDHRAVEHFLVPLPIQALHGIGPAQAGQLQRYGLHTVGALDAMAFQRARIRRLTLAAEDLRPAEEGPGTQMSRDDAREARLRLEPVIDELNARSGHRVAGPAGAYLRAS
ncbi:hypothetical protein MIU24_29620 [Streptomyces venezuelae]|uniref:hypothetical protein n=1 Tax=Streptomyces sp. B6(2022) TaxID=3404749 RepID=UPI00311DEECB